MSPEVALLTEVWDTVKNHVHISDREEVAQSLFTSFEEHVGLGDIEVYKNEFDRVMKCVIVSHFGEEELDEDPDESQEEW